MCAFLTTKTKISFAEEKTKSFSLQPFIITHTLQTHTKQTKHNSQGMYQTERGVLHQHKNFCMWAFVVHQKSEI